MGIGNVDYINPTAKYVFFLIVSWFYIMYISQTMYIIILVHVYLIRPKTLIEINEIAEKNLIELNPT